MKEPKLSIIIPVYNVENYVDTCIESLYKQGISEYEFEVILINDGSTDNSLSIIQEYENKYSNITIISQKNQGLSTTRNNGIKLAKGEYLLFVDSDDLIIENILTHLY